MIFTNLYPFSTFQVEELTDVVGGTNKNMFVWSPNLSIVW